MISYPVLMKWCLVRMRSLSLLLVLSLAAHPALGEIYRWTDARGRTHFSDSPPAGQKARTVSVQENTLQTVPAPRSAPASTRGPAARPVRDLPKVVIYTASWCGYCKAAKALMQRRHVPYAEYDIETSREGSRDFQQLGGDGVPLTLVGRTRIQGFDADYFNSVLNEAGFP